MRFIHKNEVKNILFLLSIFVVISVFLFKKLIKQETTSLLHTLKFKIYKYIIETAYILIKFP